VPAEGDNAALPRVPMELEIPKGEFAHARQELAFVVRTNQLRPVPEAFGQLRQREST